MMWRPLASRWPLRRLTVPHVCDRGHTVDMRQSAVRYAREVRWMLRCPTSGCDGYLWPAPAPDGETLRELLRLAANTIHPSPDGLERIRARIAAHTPRRPWWRRLITRITKSAAAPGWTPGAAACADGWKEPNDMSHDLIRENTPHGRQMNAALALAHLLEQDLPLTQWRIDDLGRLHGHAGQPGRDAAAREAMDDFAAFLASPVTRSQGRNDHAEWVHLAVTGAYRGAQVNVWAHVGIRALNPYGSRS